LVVIEESSNTSSFELSSQHTCALFPYILMLWMAPWQNTSRVCHPRHA